MKKVFYTLLLLSFVFVGCKHSSKSSTEPNISFSADSAYNYIAEQVSFGPRVPGTMSHYDCALYLQQRLEDFGLQVHIEQGLMTDYKSDNQPIYNIIASYNPAAQSRILLCAHWDTRPWADQEENYENRLKPVLGANDGASGVGVLLEIARQLTSGSYNLTKGIDFAFFDCEDMGTPTFYTGKQITDSWCLGSQFWAENFSNYLNIFYKDKRYQYAVLLDMVGAPNATFPREYYSMEFASQYVEKVWNTAQKLGYGNYFTNDYAYPITDDHYYINTLAHIPCIDIIHYNSQSETGFAHFWHTTHDDLTNISKETLQAVGETLLTTILH